MIDIVGRLKDAEIATHALFDYIFQDAREEIERLRSKVEAMEKQEPVAWLYEAEYSSGGYSDNYFEWRITRNKSDLYGARKIKPLYKTPRAQLAPSIPDGWKLVPPRLTHEMRDAWIECAFSSPDEIYEELLVAAPEAKP